MPPHPHTHMLISECLSMESDESISLEDLGSEMQESSPLPSPNSQRQGAHRSFEPMANAGLGARETG